MARPFGTLRRLHDVGTYRGTEVMPTDGAEVPQSSGFEELFRTHGPEAVRIAYALLGDPKLAEDIAQEAFVRVLGRFGDLRRREAFRAYLLRTVVNLTRSHLRSMKRERDYLARPPLQDAMRQPDLSEHHDLLSALSALPERQRTALVLRYFEDLSERQTAELMETTVKAVKSLVGRGLSHLREEQEVKRS